MKNFHDFWFEMTLDERQDYARRAGTSKGYAELVAGGFKLPSLGTAVRMVRAAAGAITLEGIVSVFEARRGKIA
jgi:hypothetical protein